MKRSSKLTIISAFFLSAFALGSLPNCVKATPVKADGDWEIVDTRVLPTTCLAMYDASDAYIYFKLSTNDYDSLGSQYSYVGNISYYNASEYNFLSYIQISNDNENYIPFSTIYHTSNINYFFKDGTFRFALRRDVNTIREDGSYQYIKVLEGCEFPSYSYCSTGTGKKKYVQSETTIATMTKYADGGSHGIATYGEYTPKPMMTYTGIAYGWNNAHYNGTPLGYNQLILSFGEHNVDFLSNDHTANATNRATSAYDIGCRLTINGLPIYKIHDKFSYTHVGYDHGYAYFYIVYPEEVLLMNKNNLVPTLHIEGGTEFIDVLLPEVTLKFIGGGWIASNSGEYRIEDPLDFDENLLVSLPHTFGTAAHPIFSRLPTAGSKLAFTINTGDIDLSVSSNAFNIDGLYGCTLCVFPSMGAILLLDKDNGNATAQEFYGFMFAQNADYTFEIEVTCGAQTTVKFAINHFLVINHTFNANKATSPDIWVIDTSGALTLDYYKELNEYQPVISYGGSSTYDFMEGDPVYNFAGVVDAFDLYDDNVSYANLEFEYEDGAVTNNRYNAGTWTLTIKLSIEGYKTATKVVTIIVHGKVSIAKVYYDDSEPIEVPIGSKLTPPPNPNTYREGDYDYVFDGWYLDGAKWDFDNDIVQGDMHLYSKYKKVSPHYIVTVKFEGIERSPITYSLTRGSTLPFDLFELEGATFEVYANETKITSLVVQDDVTITVKYTVVYTYVEAKEPTCTEDGNIAYWYSAVYGNYYFADPYGRELIKEVKIPKLNHDIIHLNYKDSSCHEVGNVDCYYCNNCHKHFTDEGGQNELEDWAIAKKPHVLTHHDAKDATCEEDGYVEHWTCANEPGTYYGDEECTIILDSIVISAFGHDYRAPKYEWVETANGYECKATITCTHCNDEHTETKVANKVIVREATCEREGQVSYSVSFEDPRFNAQTKIVTTNKAEHAYVFVEKVEATKEMDGIKEHYECSNCHRCFIKNGDEYQEVEYAKLFYKYKSSGCGGNIAAPSLLLFASAGALAVLLMLKRKEDR